MELVALTLPAFTQAPFRLSVLPEVTAMPPALLCRLVTVRVAPVPRREEVRQRGSAKPASGRL